MIHYLSGGSEHTPDEYVGRVIADAQFVNDEVRNDYELRLVFTDGLTIRVFDDGQSCCEHRYMTTDDDVQNLIGATFRGAVLKEGPTQQDEWGDPHEICFLEVQTDRGFVTFANHNDHNGYYGGFGMTIKEVAPGSDRT